MPAAAPRWQPASSALVRALQRLPERLLSSVPCRRSSAPDLGFLLDLDLRAADPERGSLEAATVTAGTPCSHSLACGLGGAGEADLEGGSLREQTRVRLWPGPVTLARLTCAFR